MDKKILIKNTRIIVSCDGEDRVYRDADMLIEGPKILTIGRGLMNGGNPVSGRNLNQEEVQVIRTEGKLVYLGLINTYHHFSQTFVRNLMTIDYPNMTVMDWIDEIYRIFQSIDSNAIYYSTLTSSTDLMKHGCTCAFDCQYCCTRKTGKSSVDRQMEAAEFLGIRYHAGRGTNTLPRSEGSSIPDDILETMDESLKDRNGLIGLYRDSGSFSMRQIAMAPCQPINCCREAFTEAVAVAREKRVKMHTRLGEGENESVVARQSKRVMDWYREMDFVGGDVWYAHDWEVTKEEYRALTATGTGVSHCSASVAFGDSSILNMKEMREVGILVSLGCDGSATNDSFSLLGALRMTYLMQANHVKERGRYVSAYDMLKMATVDGAETLGRDGLGSLEAGKAVNLFMINTETLELAGTLHNSKNLLVRVRLTGPAWMTTINRNIVHKGGILKGVDERKLAMEGEAVRTRVIRELHSAYGRFI